MPRSSFAMLVNIQLAICMRQAKSEKSNSAIYVTMLWLADCK